MQHKNIELWQHRHNFYAWKKVAEQKTLIVFLITIRWTYSLLRDTAKTLIGMDINNKSNKEITNILESDGDTKISDLHTWHINQNEFACIINLVAKDPKLLKEYKDRLKILKELPHITIEAYRCDS